MLERADRSNFLKASRHINFIGLRANGLKNREKALVFVRSGKLAVHVPTSRGDALLISPENSARFLAAQQPPGVNTRAFPLAARR